MASKIERLMALCDETTPANDGGVVPTEAWNRYCRATRPETLRAMLTLMQGLVMIAEQSQDEGAKDVLADFDRWNKESEDGK